MPYREERLTAPAVMDVPCDVCGDGRVLFTTADDIYMHGMKVLALKYTCQRCGCYYHIHPCNSGDKALKRIDR